MALRAVDEVGNPTILATLAVVAAILPMAFVGGLMGPYMRPIPVGASAAMVFSLVVAFIVTPWAAVRLLKPAAHHDHERRGSRSRASIAASWARSSRAAGCARWFLAGVAVLLLAAMALVPLGLVTVKMLPFDNKSEFQVMVDMPEGTALEATARVASALAHGRAEGPEVVNVQSTSARPRRTTSTGWCVTTSCAAAPHLADLQVNLLPKGERASRATTSPGVSASASLPIARRFGATLQVAEVPPGPPVLQTLVAEVYGPDPARRLELARPGQAVFEQTPGVVDIDWYVEAPQPKITLVVDDEKAGRGRLSAAARRVGGPHGRRRRAVGLLHDRRRAKTSRSSCGCRAPAAVARGGPDAAARRTRAASPSAS